MKLITTFHHAKIGRYAEGSKEHRWHYYGREKYMQREAPERVGNDSEALQKLYGTMPWEEFSSMWNDLLEEVIDNYQPDIIWFDSWLDRLPQQNRKDFAAYYLNQAKKWDKEVVITYKQKDLHQNVGVIDYEKGLMEQMSDVSWVREGTISRGSWVTTGNWSYTDDIERNAFKTCVYKYI